MRNTVKKYITLIVAFAMVAMMTITPNINAAEPTTGSLTIICHEQPNGQATNTPVKGITYKLRKVGDNETLEEAQKDTSTHQYSAKTDENGRIVFSNLEEGRYFAYVDNSSNVFNSYYSQDIDATKCVMPVEYENFLVDIPMTNAQGTGLNYDVVVEPKVKTVYGNLEILKTDMTGKPLAGVEFIIETTLVKKDILGSGTSLKKWSKTLTTNTEGKIMLNNIPYGHSTNGYYYGFQIKEKNNPNEEFFNNSQAFFMLFVYTDENGVVKTSYTEDVMWDDVENDVSRLLVSVKETENLTTLTIKNEKPQITKKVKNKFNEFVDSVGVNIKDIISFKITADVPLAVYDADKYIISDILPAGLILDNNSIKIQGATDSGFEDIPDSVFTSSNSENKLELSFDTYGITDDVTCVPKYDSIIITYDAKLNKDSMIIGGDGNVNTATLNVIHEEHGENFPYKLLSVSDTAEVHTGAVKIEKTDKLDENIKLAGAKFKVATSEANAKAGVFVTDENDADIEVTTDVQGQAMIKGLAYADNGSDVSYWLVETQAPKYTEEVDGVEVEKSYNLLKNPVEAKVGKTTHNTAVKIKNGKGLNLPATGGIGIIIFALAGIAIMTVSVILNKKKQVIER